MAVIVSKGVVQLAIALQEEQEDHIQVNTTLLYNCYPTEII